MMAKLIILVFSLLGLLSACVGQYVQLGQCDPNVQLQENFDIQEFLGTWHEYARSDNPNQNGDCATFEFASNNNVVNVQHSSVVANFAEQATGTVSQVTNTARLTLAISSFPNPIDFWVRASDYSTYAITFSCENISTTQRRIHLWVLARQRANITEMTLALIRTTIMNTFGIDFNTLRTINHSAESCYVLPVIAPGQPIILPGQCDPNLNVVQNFNVERFIGRWHQIASYETPNSNGNCARAEYSIGNNRVDVLNSQIINGTLFTIDGYATVSSTDNSAKLSVVLNIPGAGPQAQELWVLASDYDSYAISYTCVNISSTQKQVFSWILSRTRQLPSNSQALVDQAVNSYIDLNYMYYAVTNQTDAGCFFFPEPVLNQPVRFRGQCQSVNVQAMRNFDAVRYMGLWHNIELYPAPFQGGTCSNAFYDLVGGRVEVLNTQVINQRLFTINGVAVPVSTDGSAELVVSFPIAGTNQTTETDYWVLDTDYVNYALVYTCYNVNDDEMQVGSWKLSRTKQLSAAAATAINNVIDTVLVLDQRYYEPMLQTVEACFYFPEAQPGVPVVFPGQCDENVAVVPNFDFARFVGTWHEIEAYPKAEQTGQCINHQYTFVSASQLSLVSSSVDDQFLGITNGVLRPTNTNDNSGNLTITISDTDGSPINIPFWVLSTDYTDYALAYACSNINQDFRGVWSWKLSRSKQLSAAANITINSVIASNVVLDNNYYETIDQSDRACSYLPNLSPGDSIIIPGQCDTSITGVANFNLARYAGSWRLIESYASDFQVGTCNVAQYTQAAGNILNVVNSQVVAQELATISGTATVMTQDGTGKLLFYFPSRDESFEYTILDTDYDSYALGYGCVNLNSTYTRVYSWKMSRQNTLSQAAITNMNQIINNIEVLNNRFYYTVNRTEAGCFYYPQPDPTSNVRFRGTCNQNIPVVTNFDAGRYLGLWHDIESYPQNFQSGTCNNAYYSPGNDVDVYNTQVIDQTLFSIRGSASLVESTDGSAKLNVTFNVGGVNVSTDYWVLATDYTSYSFVYSCTPIDDEYVQVTSWKLSRTKALTPVAAAAINNVMNNIPVLDQRYYLPRNQTPEGCFYFPEPQPGVQVVFPGQCDNSIAAVPNFNMAQFQGTWHEIQAYPKDDQPGQCINHVFTSANVANTLDLQSSNVFDQALGLTSGRVTFTSTDGSGRLVITIQGPNGNIQIPYWVLSTDYNNYALAYSCVNIDSDYRGVWSWKLSRTKQLSAASSTAINNAIENINVLNNVYFEPIDQSDQACFYLPDLAPGEPVVLPGQCSSTITGMPNFNLQRYSGRWRLIESYGSDFQVGTCNVARYTLETATTINVINSQVVAQELATISGTANVMTQDGTGKLLFYFPSRDETFEYTILDTDYDSYALGYGCVNVNSTYRRVYSWKMSRENTLSQVANNNMNQIINNIDVLNNRFYYTVNRTEVGCFYYPQPDTTSNVRFRGTCNQNIPVVTNFDAGRYLGLWHDIESYPQNFQSGTCNNAYYSPGNDVDVYNTQVIDQTLFSIRGSASLVESTDGSAKLNVTFNVGGVNVSTDYWVLATDYDSYSFVYSCTPIDDEYVQVTSWKLSRTKSLTPVAAAAINNVMNNIPVLDQRYYLTRNQTPEGCFYYPEPQAGVPVVFPGQCDNNIAAVPNFDMTQFQGTWHEIQAYPKAEQSGQCINHVFTTNGVNTLGLLSSSISDRTLNETSGNVRFSSTDGSARLIITIPGPNGDIQIPYWVLSTDYSNYALAYSCVNINSDYRGVWSWKLSRTQQLSTASSNAINNAIENINVLNNVYFEPIDQSDQACFYLPDFAPGDQVTLPGQCDTTITGIPNFNLARYAGRWRLIESYGSRFQTGTCNVARYFVENSTTLSVTNAHVVNQGQASISGFASLISTDGSGVLRFSFPSRNQVYDYYILDTDYDSYALGYGCVNMANNQRSVRSWKFSRDNTLSEAANNNMNQIINRIDALHQPYYYFVNRTEAGCFYYPVADRNTTVRFPGQCDESIPVVNNFDVGRYLGLWHDIESYPVPFQDGSCPNAFYEPFNSTTVTVFNTHVVQQTLGTINGFATVAFTDGSAKLNVTFNVLGFNVTTNYWVLATDYDSYAFVYSCANIDDEYMSVASWKLSRTKALTPAATTAITNIMNNYNILDQRYFIDRDHSAQGCFYYPEPVLGQPVVFPGQCDTTIPAVQNFNMAQFAGRWHEIAAYPKIEQPGQCISHQFRVNGTNTIHLDSFNVINQALSTTESHVQFAGTDGSGRLTITIGTDEGPVQIPYWVLGTDYSDYALAYSCVNINSDYRGVWSWKLSRTRQLSTAANTAINNVIASVNVLGNEYYENIQQTDVACFHLPELGPNDPVVFPGQCDPNISVIQNFNSSRYLGTWRLVESYFSDFQEGTCNAATYSAAGDGSVIVVNTKVVDQGLSSITGSAVASSDGSGKLLVTFPNSGDPVELWILDTDYDNYSLIYSCINLNSEQRRVWSWKMSRNNTITGSSANAINQIVNSINVLDARYYTAVNRTDAGCFYFPEPNSATNVVFPGQCDESIPAFPNFNAGLYAGAWFDIESYPTTFQSGTCNTARYTVNPDNSIQVQNTQVVGQVLQTTSGTAVSSTNDGSAKYNVTFNLSSGDVSTKYWVLATDYTTYAFAYSCRNIDEFSRAVYSWKLSRERTLLPAALTAINNVIQSIPVLDAQYYVQRRHTEEACFYYPDNNGGDVILNGQCVADADVQAVPNFNANQFQGTWHEVARFPSTLQNGECASTQYTLAGTNTLNVVQTSVIDEALLTTTTQGSVATGGRGVISINVNGVPFNNVYILATDYAGYALAYSCRNLNATSKQVYSWKLSRSREGLSDAANTVINQIVTANVDLFEPYYRYTAQDNFACFYYPVFDQLPPTIELPGPCNTSINAIANFNAPAYLGRWFEHARYPQTAQSGQCNRAVYGDLGGGLVSVVNSQVIGETLASITGQAQSAFNDGSGLLNVTFVVGGETRVSNYYVLATDYTSYALVYSCVNLQNGNRQVGSWKLSRSTTLSNQANTVMDAVISQTQGLNPNYYQSTSQSDESCFYVPTLNLDQAPLFRGQCEDITGVTAFNAQRFVGWWHEIERYPVDGDAGDCISSRYEGSGTTLQVSDTSIFNVTAEVLNGTVTVTNDGRLRRVMGNNPAEDIWVLATDYDNYALLYSCVNVNAEYRRVWSAKHSRVRSLTQAQQDLMAPVIASNRVLRSDFYQLVDQSDSACFHYPTQTGNRVILPGQCDNTIPVVTGFEVANFQGTWYQIQRYDAVESTCVGTRLIHDGESGNIDVLIYEVINGVLVNTQGSARLNSTDGSGRLSLVLPGGGSGETQETILHVLATDNSNYALVYSCVNIDNFHRQVGAWQLSRQRTMSAVGAEAISTIIGQREELHLPYFKSISHEGQCPEPSSAYLFQSSIIVILVCAILQLVW